VDGGVISANRAMTEILGFSPIGMACSGFFSTVFGEGGEAAQEALKQRIGGGEERISLNRSIVIEGRGTLNLDIKMNSIDIGGHKQYVLGVVRDTTQRKVIETALIDSKRRLQAAFDAVSDRMYMVDSGYILRFVNMSIAEELGRGFREILGRPCYSFFNTRPEPCTNCPLGAVKEGGRGLAADVAVSYPEGTRLFRVSVYPVQPLSDADDFLVHSRDVTEEKKIQEHLIQNDRLISLGQLSAGVAHEVNNPLTSILGYAQLLLMDKDDTSDDHRELKIIEQQAMNCKAILNDLLLFSRTRVDKKEYFDINEVLDGVVVINKMEIRDKQIDVEKKFYRRLPAFFGDQIRMTQVFLNILKNAVDAVDEKGRIVLVTKYSRANKEIRVSIEDNGQGIGREDMQKIFDPFFTTKPPGKGTGLGLSVSYGIVAEHGGKIDVESEVGSGARFTVILPFVEKDEEPS
jgi:two-component system NtrC family sensor kinase